MTIKVRLGEVEPQNVKPFPKLMYFHYTEKDYRILLMKNETCGVVLHVINYSNAITNDKVGDIWDNLDTSRDGWADYNEPITLQNI